MKAARAAYLAALNGIGAKYNRRQRTILELAGEVARVPRKKGLWNIYQAWYAREGDPKPDDSTCHIG